MTVTSYIKEKIHHAKIRHSKKFVMIQCLFHKDKHPSMSITLTSGSFRCFGCGAHGGLAELIAAFEEIPLAEAVKKAINLRTGGHNV